MPTIAKPKSRAEFDQKFRNVRLKPFTKDQEEDLFELVEIPLDLSEKRTACIGKVYASLFDYARLRLLNEDSARMGNSAASAKVILNDIANILQNLRDIDPITLNRLVQVGMKPSTPEAVEKMLEIMLKPFALKLIDSASKKIDTGRPQQISLAALRGDLEEIFSSFCLQDSTSAAETGASINEDNRLNFIDSILEYARIN